MTDGYRFRVDEGKLVLQVLDGGSQSYTFSHQRTAAWRDATVADIPVADPFRSSPQWAPVESLGREA